MKAAAQTTSSAAPSSASPAFAAGAAPPPAVAPRPSVNILSSTADRKSAPPVQTPTPSEPSASAADHSASGGSESLTSTLPQSPSSRELGAEKLEKMKVTRDQITQEIVDTEVSYTSSLGTTISDFLDPLEKLSSSPETQIISSEQVNILFSNIRTLKQLNLKFLEDLKKRRTQEWTENDCMGDLFLSFAPFFKMYTMYVNNHNAASALLTELNNDTKFAAFAAERTGPSLFSRLIEPVQRIPRYKLLLEVLVKNTANDHADYEALQKVRTLKF